MEKSLWSVEEMVRMVRGGGLSGEESVDCGRQMVSDCVLSFVSHLDHQGGQNSLGPLFVNAWSFNPFLSLFQPIGKIRDCSAFHEPANRKLVLMQQPSRGLCG
jgi:hypothetical protein